MTVRGRFGVFGGAYVPEGFTSLLEALDRAFTEARRDPTFTSELRGLLSTYAGRPTPLYRCRNLGGPGRVRLYLKREDLLHGGAHKLNNVLGQALLARRMGKSRLVAETGGGQHGIAVAMVGAMMGQRVRIYMGASDFDRQRTNVFRMRLCGAEVVAVESGGKTLKDAINEALRDLAGHAAETHYLPGSAIGPHPYPSIVRDLQRVIGAEARAQILSAEGRLPDAVIACVGGGANAIGVFSEFLADRDVALVGVEAAGAGLGTARHGATLARGRRGVLHGAETIVLQDGDGQIGETHSVSRGLCYPGVGPEHAHLMTSGRASYVSATDDQALAAFEELSRAEGIIPAFESAHAIAHALTLREKARATGRELVLVVNLSGRGDKDLELAQDAMAPKERCA